MGKRMFLPRWKFLWDGKNISELRFPPAWRGLGRCLGHQEDFSCPFMKPCINPCPPTATHRQ